MLKKMFTALTVSVAALTATEAWADIEKRVALIVGNGAYENAPALANPVADAKAMAAAFDRLGFETVTGYDLDREGLRSTVRAFARKSMDADLTVFFYAGHGIGYDGRNFMVPVDAEFRDATALDFEAVSVDFVTKQMRYSDGVSLVFLDACRDNPLANTLTRSLGLSSRSAVSRGLASMDVTGAGKGLAIAFATSPGEVAYDGAGRHSPFTAALLKHIESSDTDITEVMSRVTGEVLQITDEKQRPWLNASLTGPVVLKPATADEVKVAALPAGTLTDATSAPASADLEAQTLLFNLARETNTVADYQAYLATFPNGLYANNARAALSALGESERAVRVDRPLQVAALDPGTKAAPLSFEAHSEHAAATDTAEHGAPSTKATAETEAALGLNRQARREIQHRLNLADAKVGGADGLFGPMTRAGIAKWQGASGFESSGYLSAPQVAKLKGETEEAYKALMARYQAEARARAAQARTKASTRRNSTKASTSRSTRRSTTAKRSSRTTTSRAQRQQRVVISRQRERSVNPAAAAAAGMIVGGVIGHVLSR